MAVVVGESGAAERLILSHCDGGGGRGVGRDGGGSRRGVGGDGGGSRRGVRRDGGAVVVIWSRTRRWSSSHQGVGRGSGGRVDPGELCGGAHRAEQGPRAAP